MNCEWKNKIFSVTSKDFNSLALELYRHQLSDNPVYRKFSLTLGKTTDTVNTISDIPFLPVSLFKSQEVKTGEFLPEAVFTSSGTSGMSSSRHLVRDLSVYEESFLRSFELFYGDLKDYCILALLPSYLERKGSSLIYMVERWTSLCQHPKSGFYLKNSAELIAVLKELESRKQKTILLGVTFALLDLAEEFALPLKHTIIMETGGMKGRREEMTREEVHNRLKAAFSVQKIHSEYGMTELLSQAYSQGEGVYHCPPWLKVQVRDEEDPLQIRKSGRGLINIIDLANVYSCSFLATDDFGKLNPDGSFEVLGRMDGSDLRGCSLMAV